MSPILPLLKKGNTLGVPVIADKVDLQRDDATVLLGDVYHGPGLAGVPRGQVKQLRVIS